MMGETGFQQSQTGSTPGFSQPMGAILNWPRQPVRFDGSELGRERPQTSHQIVDDDTLGAQDVN